MDAWVRRVEEDEKDWRGVGVVVVVYEMRRDARYTILYQQKMMRSAKSVAWLGLARELGLCRRRRTTSEDSPDH